MNLLGKESWTIICDVPEVLQFAAYVGKQNNFAPADEASPRSSLEAEWQEWWEERPLQHTHQLEITQRAFALPLGSRERKELLSKANPANFGWDPPEFESLSQKALLQQLFLKHWNAFLQIRETERQGLIQALDKQLQLIKPQQVVKACVNLKGSESVPPFQINLDFSPWPNHYKKEITANHYVLGMAYLVPSRQAELKSLLEAMILNLL